MPTSRHPPLQQRGCFQTSAKSLPSCLFLSRRNLLTTRRSCDCGGLEGPFDRNSQLSHDGRPQFAGKCHLDQHVAADRKPDPEPSRERVSVGNANAGCPDLQVIGRRAARLNGRIDDCSRNGVKAGREELPGPKQILPIQTNFRAARPEKTELRDMEGIWAKIAHDHVGRDPVVAFPRPGQRAFDRQFRSQLVSAPQPTESRRAARGDRGDCLCPAVGPPVANVSDQDCLSMGLPEAGPIVQLNMQFAGVSPFQFTANRTLSVGTPLLHEPIVTAARIMSASPQCRLARNTDRFCSTPSVIHSNRPIPYRYIAVGSACG